MFITNKNLDAVFFFIHLSVWETNKGISAKSIWDIYLSKYEVGIDNQMLNDILHKLEKDELVYLKNGLYYLTVEGRNFEGYKHKNKWFRKVSKKNIIEGIIYSLIVIIISWAITKGYDLFFGEKPK